MSNWIKKLFVDVLLMPLFIVLDFLVKKEPSMWGFAVHHIKGNQFIENQRAIFEFIKSDLTIKKTIFTRESIHDIDLLDSSNTDIIQLFSLKGLLAIIRCRVLFVSHSISMDYSIRFGKQLFSVLRLNMNSRIVVNLWHGIPIKRLLAVANEEVRKRTDRISYRRKEKAKYTGFIVSSDIDSYAMTAMFHPMNYRQTWITGLPRNDFLKMEIDKLPYYLKTSVIELQELKKGRKLIVYAPTYRQVKAIASANYYQFSSDEIIKLKEVLMETNSIFGFRMHYFRNSSKLFNLEEFCDGNLIFNLGHDNYPEIGPLIREADIIITDYSSVFIDAIYLDKTVSCFAYDLDSYKKEQDGLLYDLDLVFPGPVVSKFSELLGVIKNEIKVGEQPYTAKYRLVKKIFFKYFDSSNSMRVIGRINSTLHKR